MTRRPDRQDADHITVTEPHHELDLTEDSLVPVLIFVGSGSTIRTSEPQLVPFEHRLVIGRRWPAEDSGGSFFQLCDPCVSALHAEISFDGQRCTVHDLQSRNGTFVDGRPVEGDGLPLRPGAILFFGSQVAVFRMMSASDVISLRSELHDRVRPMRTASVSVARINRLVRALAPTRTHVLFLGETGVGKEVYAHSIHKLSGRTGPLVAINCAAIPTELVESELFGYARGAHSQAAQKKPGLLEHAHGGTLFLDEIGEMPQVVQAKLLRFLEDGRVAPLGSLQSITVDVRVLAATNRISVGDVDRTFGLRPDLVARLGAEPLALPPLRERIEDIGLLISSLMPDEPRPIDSVAFQSMVLYGWPTNIRGLGHVMSRASLLAGDAETIGPLHLPDSLIRPVVVVQDGKERPLGVDDAAARRRPPPTSEELQDLLARFRGNVLRVARELDRRPQLVYRWARRYGLSADHYRESGRS